MTQDQPASPQDPGSISQGVRFSQNTARVPERCKTGISATGTVVLHGPHEFMVDFLQRLASPQQVVARVVIPPTLMPAFIQALRDNIANFTNRFGPPPVLPPLPPGTIVPTIEELYEQLKISDEVLTGTYCNTVMIMHSAAEFCFDFINTNFPKPVVTQRIVMAAAHGPVLLNTLSKTWEQHLRSRAQREQQGEGGAGA